MTPYSSNPAACIPSAPARQASDGVTVRVDPAMRQYMFTTGVSGTVLSGTGTIGLLRDPDQSLRRIVCAAYCLAVVPDGECRSRESAATECASELRELRANIHIDIGEDSFATSATPKHEIGRALV